jgi:ubiquinone biosynthesis protein|tara:strand:- start:357 stop:1898 length:1542 start_codon:yes stop_codon:yes gene_type:complete
MFGFYRIINLVPALRAIISEESLIPKNNQNKVPFLFKTLKLLLFVKKNKNTDLSKTLRKLGPTWIKLGQFLSTRPDIIGKDLSDKLKKLQDKVEPFTITKAKEILQKEFKEDYEDIFIEIMPSEAAASIAQVHKGKVKLNNEKYDVAVKILRPNIEREIKRDLRNFFVTAKIMERFSKEAKRLRLVEVVKTLAESLSMEIDLRLEAAAQSEIRENIINDDYFSVPDVYWDLTRKNILISDWVDAIPAKDMNKITEEGFNKKKIGKNILKTFLTTSIRDGLFHADMHQGNLFIEKEEKIIAVDFGIVGHLDFESKQYLNNILLGFINRDYDKIANVHFEAGYVPETEDKKKFAQALRSIGEPIQGKEASDISIGNLLTQLFEITNQFNMKTQPQLLLLQKTMVVVEGVAREYDPNLNIWTESEPILNELSKIDFVNKFNFSTDEVVNRAKDIILNLPKNIDGVKKNINQMGKIIDYQGIKIHPESLNSLNNTNNNLLFYIIILLLIIILIISIF